MDIGAAFPVAQCPPDLPRIISGLGDSHASTPVRPEDWVTYLEAGAEAEKGTADPTSENDFPQKRFLAGWLVVAALAALLAELVLTLDLL